MAFDVPLLIPSINRGTSKFIEWPLITHSLNHFINQQRTPKAIVAIPSINRRTPKAIVTISSINRGHCNHFINQQRTPTAIVAIPSINRGIPKAIVTIPSINRVLSYQCTQVSETNPFFYGLREIT